MKKTTKLLWLACLCMLACLFMFSACEEATEDPDHVHSYGSWTITKEATCKETGKQERVCECGEKQIKTILKKEHNYGNWTVAKDATCKEAGAQERVCECGEKETKTIPVKEHSFGEWKVVKKATCIASGLRECICSVCGSKETRTIATASHTWVSATCVNPKTCSVCGKTDGSPLNHSYVKGVCSKCNKINPEAKTEQINIAKKLITAAETITDAADMMALSYQRAWYFTIYYSDDYYDYDEILDDFSEYVYLDKAYINDAVIDQLESIGYDTTKINGLAVLRSASNATRVVERAYQMKEIQESCRKLFTMISKDLEKLNESVVGDSFTTAFANYMYAVIDYYSFAEYPSGTYSSFVSNISSHRKNVTAAERALAYELNKF